jgi:hypothetical protein
MTLIARKEEEADGPANSMGAESFVRGSQQMSRLAWKGNVCYRLCKSNFSWRASVLKHRPTLVLEGHTLSVVVRFVLNIFPT